MPVSKERVPDKGTMHKGTPDEGASSESWAAHEGTSSEGRGTSKPATTVKAAKTTVKPPAAAKPGLRRRYCQCGAQHARRYDRDQFLVDHCFAPAVSRTAPTA